MHLAGYLYEDIYLLFSSFSLRLFLTFRLSEYGSSTLYRNVTNKPTTIHAEKKQHRNIFGVNVLCILCV
jgi:hypothetical protein